MKFFLGLIVGLILAIGIAAGGAYMAFGDLTDIGERDKSKDITRTYNLADFDMVEIGGVYEFDVTVGGGYSVVVSGAPEEMERVDVSVVDGELILDQSRRENMRRKWRNQGLEATITLPSLRAIDVSGIVDGDISGINADEFDADFSGVGSVDISGTCGHLDADISGIGDFNARDLRCQTADVDISGIGDVDIYASDEIDISVGGIGDVDIHGSPSRVEKDGSLFADISVK
ncbi:MAG: head GIN domain-containing protein [Pseudomonadota bacterium]